MSTSLGEKRARTSPVERLGKEVVVLVVRKLVRVVRERLLGVPFCHSHNERRP